MIRGDMERQEMAFIERFRRLMVEGAARMLEPKQLFTDVESERKYKHKGATYEKYSRNAKKGWATRKKRQNVVKLKPIERSAKNVVPFRGC